MNFINSLLLQIQVGNTDTVTVINEVSDKSQELSLSIWNLALKGGWIMIPIAILSVIAVYIFIERFIAIKKVSKVEPEFMNNIKQNIQDGKVNEALAICTATSGPLARMIEKGISRIGKSLDDINVAIEILKRYDLKNN